MNVLLIDNRHLIVLLSDEAMCGALKKYVCWRLSGRDIAESRPFCLDEESNKNGFSLLFTAENSSCNIHTEFECGNGECIDYQLTCDGIAHCKDKSDEKMKYCGKYAPNMRYCTSSPVLR